jgi:predicted DNA-binding transcriptional regulator AlpA
MDKPNKKYYALTDQLDHVLAQALSTDCPELIAIGEGFTAQVRLNMMQHSVPPSPQHSRSADDRLLTVKEASRKLGLTIDYLYRHADHFPFTVRVGPRQLRFSLHGMERYIRQRTTRPGH